ncbi:MAG: DUF2961 domain-containing protein [Thermoanaerobaculia bacterium]
MSAIRILALLFIAVAAEAQIDSGGPLGDLYRARTGGLAHYSSFDRTGGNDDKRAIAPGETIVLMDHKGAGVVRRWWITIAPRRNVEILRQLIVRCWWDGETSPSVEVPVADFFGMGFGEWKDFISLPLNMTSGGYNSYWPMPFRRSGRITVENRSKLPVESFYFNIDVRTYDALPDDADMPGVEYSSVAFWYQTHPHAPFPALPERLVPLAESSAPEIEAENLLERARVTGGRLQVQSMTPFADAKWSGDAQLWWVEAKPGDRLTLPLDTPAAGAYELIGFFTRAQDYGIVRVLVNGEPVGSLVDMYAPRVEPSGPTSFGEVSLRAGTNQLTIELLGKDARSAGYSNGYLVGIDGFLLAKLDAQP